jgi:hypothetical protein
VEALSLKVVRDVLVGVLPHRFAGGALAKKVFEHTLHLGKRHSVLQAMKLYGEGVELVQKYPLLFDIGGPAIGEFVLGTGWIEIRGWFGPYGRLPPESRSCTRPGG